MTKKRHRRVSNRVRKFNTRRNKVDVRNYKLLIKTHPANYENLSVTFIFADGSKKIQDINPQFVRHPKGGRILPEKRILQQLNTLKHDYGAEEYRIHK